MNTASQRTTTTRGEATPATSLIVFSMEEWGEVRRRIRIMVDELIDADPNLHVLYVAPPVDIPHELLRNRRFPRDAGHLDQIHPRLHVLRPRKWLPRRFGPAADLSLARQVRAHASRLGLSEPLLWVNDASYARFAVNSGYPLIYDITDDWLAVPMPAHRRARLESDDALLLQRSGAVVVCSPDLARSRGKQRAVELIPNGVDTELFTTLQACPSEFGSAPTAVYVGTLHAERIDVDLIVELAVARPDIDVLLVGPSSLGVDHEALLGTIPNLRMIGPRPYSLIPGYLQHATVTIVPHVVSPFTESLDPIKAYECLAAGRPTIATPVAGFRDLGPPVTVSDRTGFVAAVSAAIASETQPGNERPMARPAGAIPTWADRAESMRAVMDRVRTSAQSSSIR